MGNFNKVILMGNLTRDPELRHTANDGVVCNIGIAINRSYKDRNGTQQDEVTYVDGEAWGPRAETINTHLSKGRPILVEGRLRLDKWEEQDGGKRSKLKVVVERFEFVDSSPQQGAEDRVGDDPIVATDNNIPF